MNAKPNIQNAKPVGNLRVRVAAGDDGRVWDSAWGQLLPK
jgi:hypothetical protein